jgi:hypothetical protein
MDRTSNNSWDSWDRDDRDAHTAAHLLAEHQQRGMTALGRKLPYTERRGSPRSGHCNLPYLWSKDEHTARERLVPAS